MMSMSCGASTSCQVESSYLVSGCGGWPAGGPCGDGCSTLFCFSCSLAQMARHTMQYDKNPDWRCGTGGIGACCVDPGPMAAAL